MVRKNWLSSVLGGTFDVLPEPRGQKVFREGISRQARLVQIFQSHGFVIRMCYSEEFTFFFFLLLKFSNLSIFFIVRGFHLHGR